MNLLCLGFSYTAAAFVQRHGAIFSTISTTARQAEKAGAIEKRGIRAINLTAVEGWRQLTDGLRTADLILISAGPDEAGDPFLPRIQSALMKASRPVQLFYLSTVGVYGDHEGAVVDETTRLRPVSRRSLLRVQAETDWRRLGDQGHHPVQIFRLAGIYGPGRNALINIRQGTAKRIIKPGQVFNRIHVDDIVDTLAAALRHGPQEGVWNVCDDEPAPPQDVVAYAAGLLGIPPPPEVAFEAASLSPMARSFYGENKRVSNRRIREILGVQLTYPTYREGMDGLFRAGEGTQSAHSLAVSREPSLP